MVGTSAVLDPDPSALHLAMASPPHAPLISAPSGRILPLYPLPLLAPTPTPPPSPVYSWSWHLHNRDSTWPHTLPVIRILSAAGPTANSLHSWYSCFPTPKKSDSYNAMSRHFPEKGREDLCILMRGQLTTHKFFTFPLCWRQSKTSIG